MLTIAVAILHGSNAVASLSTLPTELLVEIYLNLGELTDAISLSQICRGTRKVWTSHVPLIYRTIASRTIFCERHAFVYRKSQVEGALDHNNVTSRDVVCIVRNARVVEDAIRQFTWNLVSSVSCAGFGSITYVKRTTSAHCHPPVFTSGERVRFARAYYQLWELMRHTGQSVQDNLRSISLRQLFYLYELSQFNFWDAPERHSTPNKFYLDYPWFPNLDSNQVHDRYIYSEQARHELHESISAHLETRYFGFHGKHAIAEILHIGAAGANRYPFLILWDHAVPLLHDAICGLIPQRVFWSQRSPSLTKPIERRSRTLYLKFPELWLEGEPDDEAGCEPVEVLVDGQWIWIGIEGQFIAQPDAAEVRQKQVWDSGNRNRQQARLCREGLLPPKPQRPPELQIRNSFASS